MKEKYNLIQELQNKSKELTGKRKLSLIGQGDFTGGNNGTVINNTFNVQATVREESDIDKIAEKLERLQRREERKRGLTPRTNR